MAQSVHIEDDEDDDENEVDQAEKEEAAQALRAEQAVLADRGAAIMCLMYLSAANGKEIQEEFTCSCSKIVCLLV